MIATRLVTFGCAGRTCELTTRKCVSACADGGGCPSGTPICDVPRSTCVACVANGDCLGAAGTPVCNVPLGRCVECVDDARCSGSRPHCDPVKLACVECTSSDDCVGQCDPVTGSCVPVGE